MSKQICVKCHEDRGFIIRTSGPHNGVYCGYCDNWIGWIKSNQIADEKPVVPISKEMDKVVEKFMNLPPSYSAPKTPGFKNIKEHDDDVPW